MTKESDDPLERLFARVAPEVPADAAERALAALPEASVARALFWGETGRFARRAAFASALLAFAGAVALVVSLHKTQGAHLDFHMHHQPKPPAPSTLASSGRDERLIADPFFVGRK
jgi:hypothetical protein